jgi:hypothetical protein
MAPRSIIILMIDPLQLLFLICQMLRSNGNTVSVLAHSLGCRVVLHALHRQFPQLPLQESAHYIHQEPQATAHTPQRGGRGASRVQFANIDASFSAVTPAVSNVFLLGAAIPANCLAKHGPFPAQELNCNAIHVFHSKHDDVLSGKYVLGEIFHTMATPFSLPWLLSPMGLEGVANPVPFKCFDHDVSETVFGHKPFLWISSLQVLSRVMGAIRSHKSKQAQKIN